jgi:hypothetical protein
MSTTELLLQQGIAAVRAGQREEARVLLMRVVEADERSEQGWLWLAGVMDDPEDMRTCLENVLDLNPGNVKAQQGLAWIESRYGPRAAPVAAPATGPTVRLAPEVAPAVPLPAAQPPPAEIAAPPDNPCPYCGAPTTPAQKHCTQCRNSLMIRTAPNEKRSTPLTILAVLWGISSAIWLLAGLFFFVIGLLTATSVQGLTRQRGGGFPIELLIPGIVILLVGGLFIAITRGLLRQARWAYFVHLFFMALGLIGTLINVAYGGLILGALVRLPAEQLSPDRARALNVGTTFLTVSLFCGLVWELIYIALTFLSHRDFYGPLVRFLPAIDTTDQLGHYNNGVAYKNRGMWYMAAREWEAAVSKAPRDLNYLHALGLAYAQIKRLYPQSAQHLVSVRHLLLSRKDELYAKAPELEQLNLL